LLGRGRHRSIDDLGGGFELSQHGSRTISERGPDRGGQSPVGGANPSATQSFTQARRDRRDNHGDRDELSRPVAIRAIVVNIQAARELSSLEEVQEKVFQIVAPGKVKSPW